MFNWFKNRGSNISEPVTTIVELLKSDSSRFNVDINLLNRRGLVYAAEISDLDLCETLKIYKTIRFGTMVDEIWYAIDKDIFNTYECELLYETAFDLVETRKLELKCAEKTKREVYAETERKRLIGLYCK